VFHIGLVYAAFYLLLKAILGDHGVVFRALLSSLFTCPAFIPREWIFFIFALQERIVREIFRILDEF
jgi:hypothetical protein